MAKKPKVTAPAKKEVLICSFCGKHKTQVRNLLTGPGVSICNECIEAAVELIDNAGWEVARTPTDKALFIADQERLVARKTAMLGLWRQQLSILAAGAPPRSENAMH
ncbi:ClpX C4-type zinc finger protein [Achromobacter sp. DH1f]|uniref:ClpX C4-type zinc finger protein n=1 Tax=Achromobacter sp. DH1f TaxID=1397275 RepID=UPI00046A999D|nr:ClpX C4-type zinc finger protein [Achromobacter sp. DH1f]